jgi:hypothetical protein
MDIKSLNIGSQGIYSINSKSKFDKSYKKDLSQGAASASSQTDKLELSEDAKLIQPIREKISSGEYNKPEVYNFLADKLNELFAPDKL